jgi:hypothetical protein
MSIVMILVVSLPLNDRELSRPSKSDMHSRWRGLPTLRRAPLGAMDVAENLAQTPKPYLDAGRISCSERPAQIVAELHAATRMAEILQGLLLQESPKPREASSARAS